MVNKRAIFATLIYSDLFHYPLTKEELWTYLIAMHPIEKEVFFAALQEKTSWLANKNEWYFLSGKSKYIVLRKKREQISKKKIQKAKRIAKLVGSIPTVCLVGLSGSLAMKNAGIADDIDFFIICRFHTVWITRLCVLLVLSILGVRRKQGEKRVKDKVCANMFVDESALQMRKDLQNIYTAHEIIQMKPLVTKGNTYRMFLGANEWVKKFLPNSLGNFPPIQKIWASHWSIRLGEYVARKIQLWYMRNKITRETVTDTFLAFHPHDISGIILTKYQQKLDKWKAK